MSGKRWIACTLAVAACGAQPRSDSPFDAAGADNGVGDTAATSGDGDDGAQPDDDGDDATDADDTAGPQPPKLDVGDPGTGGADDRGDEEGCDKVDFLFVVDNSGSMEDEQQNLVASFPGFIATIQDTLMAQDHHLAVIDTDAESLSFSELSCVNNVCSCMPEPQCCYALCSGEGPIQINPPPTECAGIPCDDFALPMGCPVTLGAGKAEDPLGNDCGIAGGLRYMTDLQPDLTEAFECVALVGAGGDGNERPMEAMTLAVSTETAANGCHDGFLRDDAILVVTFITDEEDMGSVGDPTAWKQALVDAKLGNEEAIVVLGLVGDSGAPGGVCSEEQAEDAPGLRAFADSFVHGQWASVCAASYTQFFEDAVAIIDTTCDEFVPEG